MYSLNKNSRILASAYNSDHQNFLKDFDGNFNLDLLEFCLCHGILHSYDFALKIYYKYSNSLSSRLLDSIVSRMIMSNDIRPFLIKKHNPRYFWYPELPSLETIKELGIYDNLRPTLEYIYIMLGKDYAYPNKKSLYHLCVLFKHNNLLKYFNTSDIVDDFPDHVYDFSFYFPNFESKLPNNNIIGIDEFYYTNYALDNNIVIRYLDIPVIDKHSEGYVTIEDSKLNYMIVNSL
nr:putative immunity function [Saccharomycopsis fibuligera]WOF72354.1 putative immunity function [Saccharomycopsis fibuligera]